ncbi:MAG: putative glucose/L-sorbosone dehydrogenase, distantly related to bacterial beta-galactosidase [Verrucomicrobiales bacterium]|nr:putative glucose/L-sorbosone dehydrogenase, distantly related to bacterial beta-galactosidase [Verrucomicrobiales bacterium]
MVFAIGVAGVAAQEPVPPPDKAPYAAFAARHGGDAANGRALFSDLTRTACGQCHTVDGSGSKAGPDLSGIGDKFGRADLIKSVLEPSFTIAVGYGTTVLKRKSGAVVAGVIRQATADWLELMGADGLTVRVPVDDIATRGELERSLMPEGQQAAMSPADFSDLIAYMGSLKRPPEASLAMQGEIPAATAGISFEPFLGRDPKFLNPVWAEPVPSREGRWIVLEHFGGSWIAGRAESGAETRKPLIDLRGVVRKGGATGLLGLAFHPDFPNNRRYYLKYQTEERGRISTLVVERRFDAELQGDSGQESRVLLKIPSSSQDHNGGSLEFGPDGFLYIGMGDTGPQRDPQGHGQDMGLLLGKILRIDVDYPDDALPYGIPESNPFRSRTGARPEIWALGFREPWRISFDRLTKDLWVGDVGQDRIEEVGIVRTGENHGWNVFEGINPYSDQYRREGAVYVPPVFSYPHSAGVSVTGGFVYRGKKAPALEGWYIFADYESRRVWALTQQDRKLQRIVEIGRAPSRAVSFCQDGQGELYLVGYDDGVIYHLDLGKVNPAPQRMTVLSPTAEQGPVPWRSTQSEPHEGWQRPDFDDSAWPLTPGGFGTPGTPAAVIRTRWATQDIWLRREFTVAETGEAPVLAWRVHHDEDAELYLNGIETARLPRWTQGYATIKLSSEAARTLKEGRNVIAIHCRQSGGGQYIDAGLLEYAAPAP